MHILTLPALQDNYIYLATRNNDAVVVDPGEAAPVLAAVADGDLQLRKILITHRHADHIAGVGELRTAFPAAEIIAPEGCGIDGATICRPDKSVEILGETLRVIATPGHTLEHIAFAGEEVLFCGDTLFVGGCGRVFEGTMQQMYDSLMALATLPVTTKFYCGHEYTRANLLFARAVEPDNAAVQAKLTEVENLLAQGGASVPNDIGSELQINPFLRVAEPAVIAAAQQAADSELPTPAAVFAALRRWKDNFRA